MICSFLTILPMSLRRLQHVFVADTARLTGELNLGQDVSVWYGAVIRGDVAPVTIGQGTNVQENAVVHCDHGFPNVIGQFVTIGHNAVVHGESVGDGSLIGIGARVLGHTKIGKGCLIAAGAVVPPGLEVPDGMVVMGVPGKIVRPTSDREKEYLRALPPRYIELAKLYVDKPNDPRLRMWGE